ncbi:MAG: hypothetical protein AAB706_01200 [Patescibacteria group bacterium]
MSAQGTGLLEKQAVSAPSQQKAVERENGGQRKFFSLQFETKEYEKGIMQWEAKKESSYGKTLVLRPHPNSPLKPTSPNEMWRCECQEVFFETDKLAIIFVRLIGETVFSKGKEHNLRFFNMSKGNNVIPNWRSVEKNAKGQQIVYVPVREGKQPTVSNNCWNTKEELLISYANNGQYQMIGVRFLEPIPQRPQSKDMRNVKKFEKKTRADNNLRQQGFLK